MRRSHVLVATALLVSATLSPLTALAAPVTEGGGQ